MYDIFDRQRRTAAADLLASQSCRNSVIHIARIALIGDGDYVMQKGPYTAGLSVTTWKQYW